jgi:dynein heavy chain
MESYDRVAKVVGPKKIALAGAEGELEGVMAKLAVKQGELQVGAHTRPLFSST